MRRHLDSAAYRARCPQTFPHALGAPRADPRGRELRRADAEPAQRYLDSARCLDRRGSCGIRAVRTASLETTQRVGAALTNRLRAAAAARLPVRVLQKDADASAAFKECRFVGREADAHEAFGLAPERAAVHD